MISFFLKKNFCDIWDNFFYIVVCNFFLIITVFISGFLLTMTLELSSQFNSNTLCVFVIIIFDCFLLSLIYFSNGKNASRIANFDFPRYVDFFSGFRNTFVDAIFLGFFEGILICTVIVSLPYYFLKWEETNKLLYAVFAAAIFWFLIATLFALQWFLGVKTTLGGSFFKCLKKCYILFFDNLGFTIVLFGVNTANVLITILTFGLFPSLAGIAVTNTNAFRLILQKYHWLENHDKLFQAKNRKIPWNELLAEDKHTLGNRTLKGLFFPWLDDK